MLLDAGAAGPALSPTPARAAGGTIGTIGGSIIGSELFGDVRLALSSPGVPDVSIPLLGLDPAVSGPGDSD